MKEILFEIFKLTTETAVLEMRLFRPHTRIFNNRQRIKELIGKLEQALNDKIKESQYAPYKEDVFSCYYREPTIDRFINSIVERLTEKEATKKIGELNQSFDKILGENYSIDPRMATYDRSKIRETIKNEKVNEVITKLLKNIIPKTK